MKSVTHRRITSRSPPTPTPHLSHSPHSTNPCQVGWCQSQRFRTTITAIKPIPPPAPQANQPSGGPIISSSRVVPERIISHVDNRQSAIFHQQRYTPINRAAAHHCSGEAGDGYPTQHPSCPNTHKAVQTPTWWADAYLVGMRIRVPLLHPPGTSTSVGEIALAPPYLRTRT